MAKLVMLEGKEELAKLEQQGVKVRFKVLVRQCRVVKNGWLMIRSDEPKNGAAIVLGTPDFVAVCKIGWEDDEAKTLPVVKSLDL